MTFNADPISLTIAIDPALLPVGSKPGLRRAMFLPHPLFQLPLFQLMVSDAIVAVRYGGGRTIYPRSVHMKFADSVLVTSVGPANIADFRGLPPTIVGWAMRPELGWRDGLRPDADPSLWDYDWAFAWCLENQYPLATSSAAFSMPTNPAGLKSPPPRPVISQVKGAAGDGDQPARRKKSITAQSVRGGDHQAELLRVAGRALCGELDEILVRRDGNLRLLNAGKELMWTGYEPDAELLKGLIVEVDENENPIRIVGGAIGKFYNAGESEANDESFLTALEEPGAKLHFLLKEDGTNGRFYVNPANGNVEVATRGMLQSGMGASTYGDFSEMARSIAMEKYPALLDPELIGRYTPVVEIIHPDNRIVTWYGDRRDLPVITVIDLETGAELTRAEKIEFCERHGLSPIAAFRPKATDFWEAIAELRASWAGTDIEGTVAVVELPGAATPMRLKIKGERYLELMRLNHYCTLRRTRELAEANDFRNWPAMLAHLQREIPDLPEEVRMGYQAHFVRYIAWAQENEVEVNRLIARFATLPRLDPTDRAARGEFARSIATDPDRWAFFMLIDKGDAARSALLAKVAALREKELPADTSDEELAAA